MKHKVCSLASITVGGGVTVKVEGKQIALFQSKKGVIHAVQNMCPHKRQMVIGRGLIGDESGTPIVSCALHKNSFSLEDGSSMDGKDWALETFSVEIMGENVFLEI